MDTKPSWRLATPKALKQSAHSQGIDKHPVTGSGFSSCTSCLTSRILVSELGSAKSITAVAELTCNDHEPSGCFCSAYHHETLLVPTCLMADAPRGPRFEPVPA